MTDKELIAMCRNALSDGRDFVLQIRDLRKIAAEVLRRDAQAAAINRLPPFVHPRTTGTELKKQEDKFFDQATNEMKSDIRALRDQLGQSLTQEKINEWFSVATADIEVLPAGLMNIEARLKARRGDQK